MINLFNEDQIDCLKELINISYGKATAMIAEVMDAFATMHVPKIELLNNKELVKKLIECCTNHIVCFVTIQLFKGKFDGETIFLIDDSSVDNLMKHLKEELTSSHKCDLIIELSNIITSSLISELSKLLKTDVYFNEPSCMKADLDLINSGIKGGFEYAILVDILLEFKEQKIKGEVLILTHQKSFDWLRDSLNKILKELN